jgi:hypothetical protein
VKHREGGDDLDLGKDLSSNSLLFAVVGHEWQSENACKRYTRSILVSQLRSTFDESVA